MTTTTTATIAVTLGSNVLTLIDPATIGDDRRQAIGAACVDVITGHIVPNSANGPHLVYGNAASLIPYWDQLILDVDIPFFQHPTFAREQRTPIDRLRALAAGFEGCDRNGASRLLAALSDRLAATILDRALRGTHQ